MSDSCGAAGAATAVSDPALIDVVLTAVRVAEALVAAQYLASDGRCVDRYAVRPSALTTFGKLNMLTTRDVDEDMVEAKRAPEFTQIDDNTTRLYNL